MIVKQTVLLEGGAYNGTVGNAQNLFDCLQPAAGVGKDGGGGNRILHPGQHVGIRGGARSNARDANHVGLVVEHGGLGNLLNGTIGQILGRFGHNVPQQFYILQAQLHLVADDGAGVGIPQAVVRGINAGHDFSIDDGFNLLKLHVKEAEKDGALKYIASTYDPYDQIIRDGLYPGGRKVITFANILQHDVFPLPRILQLALKYGQQEMRRPVEIEFAATMNREKDKTGTFYLLQIRPIVDSKEMLDEDLTAIPDEKLLLRSNNSLGHGIMNELQDVIYVKTDNYSASHNQEIAWEIEKLNQQFLDEGKNYVLIGPGRWGSSDTWLGIPVKWPHISAARIIVEAGLTNYRVDPSQGTHFFQNLTSFGVGYFTINAFMNDGVYNQDLLNAQPAVYESKYLRHVHFEHPITAKMDGKKKQGVVLLPS